MASREAYRTFAMGFIPRPPSSSMSGFTMQAPKAAGPLSAKLGSKALRRDDNAAARVGHQDWRASPQSCGAWLK
jgi:hypothetical protein